MCSRTGTELDKCGVGQGQSWTNVELGGGKAEQMWSWAEAELDNGAVGQGQSWTNVQ